ncbi:hypothetical protein ACFSYD_01240 [Paracoccus aerius]
MQIDDETLMALADGELDQAEAARVSAAVARDPEAQARLRLFTETRARLKILASAAPAPSDKDLIARIRAASSAVQASGTVAPTAPPCPRRRLCRPMPTARPGLRLPQP